jgi:hypothetical protein
VLEAGRALCEVGTEVLYLIQMNVAFEALVLVKQQLHKSIVLLKRQYSEYLSGEIHVYIQGVPGGM